MKKKTSIVKLKLVDVLAFHRARITRSRVSIFFSSSLINRLVTREHAESLPIFSSFAGRRDTRAVVERVSEFARAIDRFARDKVNRDLWFGSGTQISRSITASDRYHRYHSMPTGDRRSRLDPVDPRRIHKHRKEVKTTLNPPFPLSGSHMVPSWNGTGVS